MIDQLTYRLNMKRIKGYKRARAKKQALKTLKTISILIAFLSISLVIMGFDSLADLIIK